MDVISGNVHTTPPVIPAKSGELNFSRGGVGNGGGGKINRAAIMIMPSRFGDKFAPSLIGGSIRISRSIERIVSFPPHVNMQMIATIVIDLPTVSVGIFAQLDYFGQTGVTLQNGRIEFFGRDRPVVFRAPGGAIAIVLVIVTRGGFEFDSILALGTDDCVGRIILIEVIRVIIATRGAITTIAVMGVIVAMENAATTVTGEIIVFIARFANIVTAVSSDI